MTDARPVCSMTGFGHAERAHGTHRVTVEVRSVNNRHLKLTSRHPSSLEKHAKLLEDRVRKTLARGTVWLNVTLHSESSEAPARIVTDVLRDYVKQIRAAGNDVGLSGASMPMADLLRLPGVLDSQSEPQELDEDARDIVLETCDAALAALVDMRRREGEQLDAVMRELVDHVEAQAGIVESRIPEAVREHQEKLRVRLATLLEGDEMPADVLAREVALLADKTDVAEEVARLRSHALQAREALTKGGEVGRRLDFLAQEMGREANTIGSKSQDDAISRAVVELKLTIERLKEQAANLE